MAIAEPEIINAPEPNHNGESGAARDLVLDSLEIKNFRAFRHLVVPKLGRVNLITGKNNVGKSSLLEALWLYSNQATPSVLRQLLRTRDELPYASSSQSSSSLRVSQAATSNRLRDLALSMRSIFCNYPSFSNLPFTASIGSASPEIGKMLFVLTGDPDRRRESSKEGGLSSLLNPPTYGDVRILVAEESATSALTTIQFYDLSALDSGSLEGERTDNNRLVRPNSLSQVELNELWDSISLTDLGAQTIEQLRLIYSDVEQIAFRSRSGGFSNIPFARLKNEPAPVPLRSLGDGVNRLFAITVCLVNCGNGILLVDEIENGLHYSVLPDVWRLIFQTARRLNVQVFATTHSWDCIEAFQQAAAEDEESEGMLIRLRNKSGDVVATVLDEEDLAVITRDGLEVR